MFVYVAPPLVDILYPVIAEPPSFTGEVNSTEMVVLSGVRLTRVGASGTVYGVVERELDAVDSPAELYAFNFIVYAVPFVNPVITYGLVCSPISTKEPSFKLYLYPVMVNPPVFTGGVNDIEICIFPAVSEVIVGAFGIPYGVADTEIDGDESSVDVYAINSTVYVVPFVSPVIVNGLATLLISIYVAPPFKLYL